MAVWDQDFLSGAWSEIGKIWDYDSSNVAWSEISKVWDYDCSSGATSEVWSGEEMILLQNGTPVVPFGSYTSDYPNGGIYFQPGYLEIQSQLLAGYTSPRFAVTESRIDLTPWGYIEFSGCNMWRWGNTGGDWSSSWGWWNEKWANGAYPVQGAAYSDGRGGPSPGGMPSTITIDIRGVTGAQWVGWSTWPNGPSGSEGSSAICSQIKLLG